MTRPNYLRRRSAAESIAGCALAVVIGIALAAAAVHWFSCKGLC